VDKSSAGLEIGARMIMFPYLEHCLVVNETMSSVYAVLTMIPSIWIFDVSEITFMPMV